MESKFIWRKYFWKKRNDYIIGLYSAENNKESYHAEITLNHDFNLENFTLLNQKAYDIKWRNYFINENMLSISQTIKLDNILWNLLQ